MGKNSIRVTLSDDLQEHVRRQVTEGSRYRDADDYISALVSRDLQIQAETAAWLSEHLGEAARAAEGVFRAVSAEDVIERNKKA
ncbi:transcriptional regulator [Rhizobium sp. S-51]|uniref:Transcriptional regulator n=1 Tax=Rhizobium terricola TaxID=2728849 RepID=A0A7Y0FVJ9_9HYPH|nr:transcriptional regulator [Rhizobium terricola]NML74518.1 transcriptional regulator [Rhizobium terricola]